MLAGLCKHQLNRPRTIQTLTTSSSRRPPSLTSASCSRWASRPATKDSGTIASPTVTTGIKSLVDQVDQIKDSLRSAIRELSTIVDTVKANEREKRTTEKEIEAIRTKLRQIQNVTI